MRTQVVLIDYENVRPESVEVLRADCFQVLVFCGETQAKISLDLALSPQAKGNRVQYIRMSGTGPSALDFHIAYYIGRLSQVDPTSQFHIVSKDKGFDPLVRHLRASNILAARVDSVLDIPPIPARDSDSFSGACPG